MRRRLKGGSTDLKAEKSYSFLILFFFLSQYTYPQIPINGFCEYNSYAVPSGYNHCLPVDINGDSQSEIILYSSTKKKIAYISNLINRNDLFIKEYTFPFEISILKQLKNKNRYFFSSRQNRLVGLLNISTDGEIKILSTMEFDSFPENINVGNINNYGTEEFLVSGSGFEGLSFIYQYKGGLGESKIVDGSSYCFVTLIDLNNDSYYDVAACNLLERALQFYFNDGDGNFELERSIPSDKNYYGVFSSDIDNDNFEDLIVSNSGSITIMYGDFQSSYKRTVSLPVGHIPNKVLPGDFNKDGITDLAYLDYTNGAVSVIFGVSGRKFYREVLYKKESGLTDLHQINNELWFLNDDGKLFSIKIFNRFKQKVNFAPAVDPKTIQQFDYNNDNIADFCFIDDYKSELNFLIRDNKGIPSFYYAVPVSSDHKEIIAEKTFHGDNVFYCYTKGTSLIEIIKTNFKNNSFERKQLYSPAAIQDLKVEKVDSSLTNIFITYNDVYRFVLGKFEYKDLSITYKQYPFVDRNVLHSELIAAKEAIIYYWKEYSDTLYYKRATIKMGPNKYENIIQIPKTDSVNFTSLSSKLLNKNSYEIISIVGTGDGNFRIVSDFWKPKISIPLIFPDWLNIKDENQLSFSLINSGSKNFLAVYLPKQKSLSEIDFNNNGKRLNFAKLIDSVDAADYFLERVFQGKQQIVFSNKSEKCISVIQLK